MPSNPAHEQALVQHHLRNLDLYAGPRSWAERAYPKLIHFNTLPKGSHFAAWEQPELFSEEVRVGFRSLRK